MAGWPLPSFNRFDGLDEKLGGIPLRHECVHYLEHCFGNFILPRAENYGNVWVALLEDSSNFFAVHAGHGIVQHNHVNFFFIGNRNSFARFVCGKNLEARRTKNCFPNGENLPIIVNAEYGQHGAKN
jgi:hypothetical protein